MPTANLALPFAIVAQGCGGSGAAGMNAANRFGGGGSAAGGWTEEEFDAAELASSLTIAVGTGGTGAAGVSGTANGAGAESAVTARSSAARPSS